MPECEENTSRQRKLIAVRRAIADKVTEFIYSTNDYIVFKTFTGSGKTTNILKTLDSMGVRYIYAAPSHDIINENLRRSKIRYYNFLQLEGRDRLCLRPELKKLASSGIDIKGYCKACEFRDNACKYQQTQQEAITKTPNLAITHAHLTQWLPKFLEKVGEHYDVLIVDENPVNSFIIEKSVKRSDVSALRDCMLLGGAPNELIRLLDAVYKNPIDYNELKSFSFDTKKAITYSNLSSDIISQLFINGDISNIPVNFVPMLMEIYQTDARLEDMIFYIRGYLNLAYFKPGLLNVGLKVIGLDGTADRRVWRNMFETDEFELFKIDYRYKNAYQLNGGRYSIMSWKHENSTVPKRLCELVDLIAEGKKRKVLFVGTKSVNYMASKMLKANNIEFAVYYNLRSKNSFYRSCDTIILAVEPNPPQEKIDSCVALSGWPESVWRHIFREEEMLQAIGRLRQNIETFDGIRREKMEIFIFPSTGVNGMESELLPEAKVISKSNLVDMLSSVGNFDVMFAYDNMILDKCPTSINAFSKDVGITWRNAAKYFRRLQMGGFIYYDGKKYRRTHKGDERLHLAKEEAEGIIV